VSAPDFSRMVKARHLPPGPLTLEASKTERTALAERFGVVAVDGLRAEVTLSPDKQAVVADGRLRADLVQNCAVSGEDFPTRIDEPLALRFVPPSAHPPEEEIEFDADEPDEIEYEGEAFDLGEAVAQTLALAIDPYARGPNADAVRKEVGLTGEGEAGPFAALAALKKM
jgi:uncharacterized metal-binding protein YceD (DUF177 family)